MRTEDKSFQAGLSESGFEALKRKLVDLVEPLSDHQLLDLADGIHDLLRQRRAVRQHHADRMSNRIRRSVDIRI